MDILFSKIKSSFYIRTDFFPFYLTDYVCVIDTGLIDISIKTSVDEKVCV